MGKLALYSACIDAVISLTFITYFKDQVQIDWTSYVAQGEAVLDGIYDYSKIIGPMGPIAYLGGHAYLYAFLSYIGVSANFKDSQLLWTALHIFSTYILVAIVEKSVTSKRLQYTLAALYPLQFRERVYTLLYLQNDFIMVLFLQLALYFLLKNHTMISILMFNFAISMKLGAIMWLPGYLLVLAKKRSILCPIFFLVFTFALQYALAYPFIQTNAEAFIQNTFGTNRRIVSDCTVLWYLLPDDIFMTKKFAIFASAIMLGANLLFLFFKWTNWRTFFADIRLYPLSLALEEIEPSQVVKIVYTSVLLQSTFNFQHNIQFFMWYSPAYPYLVVLCKLPLEVQFILATILDYGALLNPSYPQVKMAASLIHLFLIYMMWTGRTQDESEEEKIKEN